VTNKSVYSFKNRTSIRIRMFLNYAKNNYDKSSVHNKYSLVVLKKLWKID